MNCKFCQSPLDQGYCNFCFNESGIEVLFDLEAIHLWYNEYQINSFYENEIPRTLIWHRCGPGTYEEILQLVGHPFTPSNFKQKLKTYLTFL